MSFKRIFLILTIEMLYGCTSTAWVQQYREDGGIIGYENRGDDIEDVIHQVALQICPPYGEYKLNADTLKSQEYSGTYNLTTYRTVRHEGSINSSNYLDRYSYSGSSTIPVNETHTYHGTNYWRVMDISCTKNNPEGNKNLASDAGFCTNASQLNSRNLLELKDGCILRKKEDSCFLIGRHLWCDGDKRKASEYFISGCKLGNKESCNRLGKKKRAIVDPNAYCMIRNRIVSASNKACDGLVIHTP